MTKEIESCEYMHVHEDIVKAVQEQMPEEELLLKANQWELSHGGLSGRTAQQFVDYLLGLQ